MRVAKARSLPSSRASVESHSSENPLLPFRTEHSYFSLQSAYLDGHLTGNVPSWERCEVPRPAFSAAWALARPTCIRHFASTWNFERFRLEWSRVWECTRLW